MKITSFLMTLLFLILLSGTVFAQDSRQENSRILKTLVPPRLQGQKDVLQLRCDPIPTVRVGIIGLGMRGYYAVSRLSSLEGVKIQAICDFEQNNINRVQKLLNERDLSKTEEYTGEDGWKKLCERNDIDLIYICTDWKSHTPIATYAMEKGKHAAIEGPAATTIEECWSLVNTAEKAQKHCMILENCCYDEFELATLNMAQNGLFGEVVHAEGAYIHNLKKLMFSPRYVDHEIYKPGIGYVPKDDVAPSGYWNSWRKNYSVEHTGNPYPTHGLGPVCQILNIHRGDKMKYLVSVSSDQFGLTAYAEKTFGKDSPEAKEDYKHGDMNTTIIKTEKGKTIMLQHNGTNPRPYNRIHSITGTDGFAQKYPIQQVLLGDGHRALPKNQLDSLLVEYKHPFYTEIGEEAKKLGRIAHGGMDLIMDYRLIYCLRNGLPLDIDVYDTAEWSCIVPLSEKSVLNDGAPVEVPDFTRGSWKKLKQLEFFSK